MNEPAEWTPTYHTITTKVVCEMEPAAQLISVLLDTLNHEVFEVLPPDAIADIVLYVAQSYGVGTRRS